MPLDGFRRYQNGQQPRHKEPEQKVRGHSGRNPPELAKERQHRLRYPLPPPHRPNLRTPAITRSYADNPERRPIISCPTRLPPSLEPQENIRHLTPGDLARPRSARPRWISPPVLRQAGLQQARLRAAAGRTIGRSPCVRLARAARQVSSPARHSSRGEPPPPA